MCFKGLTPKAPVDKPRMKSVLLFPMRFELEILDGTNRGKRLLLRNGLILGKTQEELSFDDPEMFASHAVINYSAQKSWNIECLAPSKMRLGTGEVVSASLIPGLIFHLGQTGFKVVERIPKMLGPWKEALRHWLEAFQPRKTATEIFFFLHPIRLIFVRGPQLEEAYTLSYGPRELGYNNLDLNIQDPSAPRRVARFFQVGDQSYIENLCGDRATINGAAFDQHRISKGDLLRVSSCVIELSVLS